MVNPGPGTSPNTDADSEAGRESDRADLARFKWLWRTYGRRHLRILVVALVLMVLEGSVVGAVSLLMEPMFDRGFVEGSQSALLLVGAAILGLFVLRAVVSTGQKVLLKLISERMNAHMRQDMIDHVMALDGEFHARHPPGYLIERLHGDTNVVVSGARVLATGLGRDLLSLIVLFAVAIRIDPVWTLVAISGLPLIYLPTVAIQRFTRRISARAREVAARMSLRLDEVFHGIATVKLNRLERYQSERYRAANAERIKTETQSELGRAMIPGVIDILTGFGVMGVMLYGGGEIVSGDKTVGEFMTFFTAIALAFEPVRRLGNLSGKAKTMAASLQRIQDIFETRPSVTPPARPQAISAGDVVFENVTVSFADQNALDGFHLQVRAGTTTALVGASGAGKTTVFQALTRLAPITSGRITVGDTEISTTDPSDLRGLFSVVSQDALLFDETIRENITFGSDVRAEDLQRAVDGAFVSDFLPKQPRGLETLVGPRGSNLSGGQRQRVAIARALLRDAPILLLDEATSALDAESEVKVQAALERLSKGRTTIVIAHRLSTIRDADCIVVMDRGKAVESGSHDELIAQGGAYARLHALQFRD